MPILVIPLAPRRRLLARSPGAAEPDPPAASSEYAYVLSPDGLNVGSEGRAAAALLPRADSVVVALADTDVSWHRISLPKAAAARMRAALVGVLEEALLDDAINLHLALPPLATAGQPTWVAAVDRAWLRAELAALQKAGVFVDRVMPLSWPDDPPIGHFSDPGGTQAGPVSLCWSHADGVACVRLSGGLARSLVPQPAPETAQFSATPGAATTAERWLNAAVVVETSAQRALRAMRSPWNLRQFDLARRNRGMRALREALRGLLSPAWRPLRIGLATLVVTQLIGLNAWAWHLRSVVAERRAAQVTLLQSTFPQVRAVLDAPLQMRREAATLRAAAGKPDDADLEPLLQAAAAVWPNDLAAVQAIRFDPGRLTLAAPGWDAGQVERFRAQLRPHGLQVETTDGRLVLSRVARPGGSS